MFPVPGNRMREGCVVTDEANLFSRLLDSWAELWAGTVTTC